jgi:hypothetical protein
VIRIVSGFGHEWFWLEGLARGLVHLSGPILRTNFVSGTDSMKPFWL